MGKTLRPIDLRRKEVMRLKLQRYTIQQIADELEVSTSTINGDVRACQAIWAAEFKADRDTNVTDELANLNNIEALLHKTLQGRTDPVEVSTLTARLMNISAQRAKILGIETSARRNPGDNIQEYNTDAPIKVQIEVIAPGNRVEVESDDALDDDLDLQDDDE